MHQSFLELFCEQCGFANDPAALLCSACQHPLTEGAGPPNLSLVTWPPASEVMSGQSSVTENAAKDFPPGTILAESYRIQKEIGRGGFSIVYRAIEVGDWSRQAWIMARIVQSARRIDAGEWIYRTTPGLTNNIDICCRI